MSCWARKPYLVWFDTEVPDGESVIGRWHSQHWTIIGIPLEWRHRRRVIAEWHYWSERRTTRLNTTTNTHTTAPCDSGMTLLEWTPKHHCQHTPASVMTNTVARWFYLNKLSPRGRRDDTPPADGSSTRGGSTSVHGRVHSPHITGGRPAAGSQRAYSLGWDRQMSGQIVVSLNAPLRRGGGIKPDWASRCQMHWGGVDSFSKTKTVFVQFGSEKPPFGEQSFIKRCQMLC